MKGRQLDGWQRLPSGYDVEFRHGIPVRLSDNGRRGVLSESELCAEIEVLGGLSVEAGEWVDGEKPGEREAPLFVDGDAFVEVLGRLARASAALFVDRFHKPVDAADVDWDRLEYLKDFSTALGHCRLAATDVDQDACFDGYAETMHRTARRLVRARTQPPVEPE